MLFVYNKLCLSTFLSSIQLAKEEIVVNTEKIAYEKLLQVIHYVEKQYTNLHCPFLCEKSDKRPYFHSVFDPQYKDKQTDMITALKYLYKFKNS